MIDELKKHTELVPTHRYCLDVGRICSHNCKMCYYANQEMTSMLPLTEVKLRLANARHNGDTELEYTGGEPTMHKDIIEIIKFAKKIGFKQQRIITNGYMPEEKFKQCVDAGVKQWLVSLHDIGEGLDLITQTKDSWKHMLRTIKLLKELGCEVYGNTTVIKQNINSLTTVAKFAIDNEFSGMTFINWNEYYDNQGKRESEFRARITDIQPQLEKAIDMLQEENITINLRYFPMCTLNKKYRRWVVNMPQVMFDPWEWSSMGRDLIKKDTESHLRQGRTLQKNICMQDGVCGTCGIHNVCGGCNKMYVRGEGDKELIPQDEMSDYPYYYKDEYECDIIIPSYLPSENLRLLEAELEKKTIPPFNIIKVRKFQSAAKNRNYGLKRSDSPWIIMMDDDICNLPYGWNRRLIRSLKHNTKAVAVSARLLNTNGDFALNSANNFDSTTDIVKVNMIPTACCIFRQADIKKTKTMFDERFVGSYWEDTCFFATLNKRLNNSKIEYETNFLIDNCCLVVHLNDGKEGNNDYNKNVFDIIKVEEDF